MCLIVSFIGLGNVNKLKMEYSLHVDRSWSVLVSLAQCNLFNFVLMYIQVVIL